MCCACVCVCLRTYEIAVNNKEKNLPLQKPVGIYFCFFHYIAFCTLDLFISLRLTCVIGLSLLALVKDAFNTGFLAYLPSVSEVFYLLYLFLFLFSSCYSNTSTGNRRYQTYIKQINYAKNIKNKTNNNKKEKTKTQWHASPRKWSLPAPSNPIWGPSKSSIAGKYVISIQFSFSLFVFKTRRLCGRVSTRIWRHTSGLVKENWRSSLIHLNAAFF